MADTADRASWDELQAELDAWQQTGRQATFWWRDDDATRRTPPLDRLLGLGAEADVPLALAVIPRDVDDSLAGALGGRPDVAVLQHGFAHANHAPGEDRQEEYGPHRPRDVMLDEIARGWRRLEPFPTRLPVMVAPWNRMDAALIPDLPAAGLAAVSTLGPRDAAVPAPGIRRTNVHVDIVDWQGGGGFMGDDRVLSQVIGHLAARRAGTCDADEPTGLMTHHLFHDDGCWDFIGRFLAATTRHPAVRWLDAQGAFWP